MKKILILITVFIVGSVIWLRRNTPTDSKIESTELVSPAPAATQVVYTLPTELKIPRIGVDAEIQTVGKDTEGNMDVPISADIVGWWQYGAKPGESGSAVLAGHLDSPTGEPGVFYRLNELVIGDEIVVTDIEGKDLKYVVVGKEKFADAAFPLQLVFGRADGKFLNLITCDGVFDRTVRRYQDRLVIFAEYQKN